jgi:hypothetical protein
MCGSAGMVVGRAGILLLCGLEIILFYRLSFIVAQILRLCLTVCRFAAVRVLAVLLYPSLPKVKDNIICLITIKPPYAVRPAVICWLFYSDNLYVSFYCNVSCSVRRVGRLFLHFGSEH